MPKVLVVDHNVELREALYDALTQKGHVVSTAGTGGQALETLKAQRPNAVVLEMGLPGGMSGLDAAKRIREFDEAVPIIVVEDAAHPAPKDALQRLSIKEIVSRDGGAAPILQRLEPLLAVRAGGSAETAAVSGTLLIIDDDVQIHDLLRMFFKTKGLRVAAAASGEEGLKALAANKPALVLLDVNMPGMDGVMALKKIKTAQPKLPVGMMSGGGEESMARAALAAGAFDYISKPFSLEYLETIVLSKVLLGMEAD